MKFMILVIFLFSSYTSATCLTDKEKIDVKKGISKMNEFYSDVPNYIQCKSNQTFLEKFVCKKEDYLLLFKFLSQINVYSHENAMKYEVDHSTYNQKLMVYWTKTYSQKKIDAKELCNELKTDTINDSWVNGIFN